MASGALLVAGVYGSGTFLRSRLLMRVTDDGELTLSEREGTGGMDYINQMMAKFAAKHTDHIMMYGDDN